MTWPWPRPSSACPTHPWRTCRGRPAWCRWASAPPPSSPSRPSAPCWSRWQLPAARGEYLALVQDMKLLYLGGNVNICQIFIRAARMMIRKRPPPSPRPTRLRYDSNLRCFTSSSVDSAIFSSEWFISLQKHVLYWFVWLYFFVFFSSNWLWLRQQRFIQFKSLQSCEHQTCRLQTKLLSGQYYLSTIYL